MSIAYEYDDGGRKAAGFKGNTGDCVTRAIAIATGKPYHEVYNDLFSAQKKFGEGRSRAAKSAACNPSPRTGVVREVYEPYLISLGWEWVPTMQVGQGCKVHLRADEIPTDRVIIARLSRHIAAVKWGTLRDTSDCSRNGTRCVYGYFQQV